METISNQIALLVGGYIPNLIGALFVLVIGWLIALSVSALLREALRRTKVDNKLASWILGKEKGKTVDAEEWIAKGAYYLIMLFVLVAFFQSVGLTLITEPLNQLLVQIFQYVPRLIGAGFLLLAAWLVANAVKFVTTRSLRAAKIDSVLGGLAAFKEEKAPVTQTISDAVYWLVFLVFLPAVLDTLSLQGVLGPVQEMLNKLFGFLPNIFAAGMLLVVGWFIARIIRRITTNLLASVGADQFSKQVGLSSLLGKQQLSGAMGVVVYVLILIPVLIAALNALDLDAITQPATNMLNRMLLALPNIFAASVVVMISYATGRVLSGLLANFHAGFGYNKMVARLGLVKTQAKKSKNPSAIVGSLVFVAMMLFALIEAFQLIGFMVLADLLSQFLVFAGHIIFGLAIFAIGLYLANLAAKAVQASRVTQAQLLAVASRLSIILLAGAMGLRQMGLANEIITLAFGLLLGALAVAVAIAFGLGGRETAARLLEELSQSVKSKK